MPLCDKTIRLIRHSRKTIEELAESYHDGGNWGDGLAGYCGIASRFLIGLAKRNGIYGMRLVCGTFNDPAWEEPVTHCWIEYKEFCIDLTISQFSEFHNKPYRICLLDSDFYRSHYLSELSGSNAVKHQKQFEDGQNYESCSSILWRIHKKNYRGEYEGLI